MQLTTPTFRRWREDGLSDLEGFWERAARELPWFRTWDQVYQADTPSFRWFLGARTNLSYNAVDRHVAEGEGGRTALVSLDERGGRVVLTYSQLHHEIRRVAAALRGLGVGKGDRVTLSMPTCSEAVVLMLACARIGAIHSVVFAGFGAQALSDRISASGSKVVFTADVTYRKGKDVPLKPIVDQALAAPGHPVERVVVLERSADPPSLDSDRELSWTQFITGGQGQDDGYESMEANEPAFILATSGTTAKPKLAVHVHGGYQVHIASMAKWCFGMSPADVWWATSDIGWIVGHSYMVYAPLLIGCTTVVFEGALDYPEPDSIWRAVVEEIGATGIFTSATAVRALMRYGDDPLRTIDHNRVARIFSAGEVLNPPAWDWLQNTILQGRIPVIDHMWQTETSGPIFGNPYGLGMLPIKPGSATMALPGIDAAIVNQDGTPCEPNQEGIMVIRRPFPGLVASLWGEPERYADDYWNKIPGFYYSGDSARVDEDGYVWFGGRADEIIKIAAHRIGTIEVESACLKHPAVAECGVIGRPDETRGEVISAFVLLKQGQTGSDALRDEIVATLRRELGPVAVVGELNFVSMLPKTRSGKIMRRVLRAVTLDTDPGDITTIEDEGSVEEARQAWREMKAELGG